MLAIVIALICGVAVTGLIAFVLMCLGIRREDHLGNLDGPAPGVGAALARRFTGLRAQRPQRPASADSQDSGMAKERARAGA